MELEILTYLKEECYSSYWVDLGKKEGEESKQVVERMYWDLREVRLQKAGLSY